MPEIIEKRGPIVKGPKGWPVNRLGVVILVFFATILIFLVIMPLSNKKSEPEIYPTTARITSPQSGQIIESETLPIELDLKDSSEVAKVQFWVMAYVDNKWEMIGEVQSAPFFLDWEIPDSYRNKAIVITSHLYYKDGTIIKDPGGWREGLILLSPRR